MKGFSLIILLVISTRAFGQSHAPVLVTGAGDSFKNDYVEVEWSIGEVLTETYFNDTNSLTQGFHQPEYDVVAAVDDTLKSDFEVRVFPNPTSEVIDLRVTGKTSQTLTYELIDLQGKVLLSRSISDLSGQINVSGLSQNIYLLKVLAEGGKLITSFKIQKVN